MTTHYSTCPLDCPGACALAVEVENGRLARIGGWKAHPFTRGVICGKVNRYREIQEGERILRPLLRDGPKGSGWFREADWDEALEVAAARLRTAMARHGPQTVLPYYYGGTMGVVQQKAVERLAHHAGFSRLGRTICFPIAESGWLAGVGATIGPAPEEAAESDLVVLWGINAVSTHVNFMTLVKAARGKGARLVVVDPYRTRTARLADLHLNPRPGTDAALACAVMQVLLEEGFADRDYLARQTDFDAGVEAHLATRTPEWAAAVTGLDAETIRAFARVYGHAARPFIRIGLGMSRQRNGAVNVHAVSCLPSVTGAWPRRGAGALFATGAAFQVDDGPVRRTDLADPAVRELDMSRLGRWLTDPGLEPPVTALLVFNANPAGSCPELGRVHAGLAREDLFTLVHEQVMTDSARFADVVLPATTFLEHPDLYKSYGQYTLQLAEAVLPPTGAARCNHEVINALARRLGLDGPDFSGDSGEMIDRVLAASGLPPRAELARRHWIDCAPPEEEAHFRTGFPQPGGRFRFRPAWADPAMPALPDHWPVNRRDLPEAARYPLDFMTPPAHEVLNTTFSATPSATRRLPPRLWIHPEDAAARGIADGDRVAVYNDLARLQLVARVTTDVRPGLTLCESNFRSRDFPGVENLNHLAHGDPVAPRGGPAFHDNRVEVVRMLS